MIADEQNRFLQELATDLNSRNISLPSFPDVVINIRTALEDPTCTAERLAAVVRTDPVLVVRLLLAANSAFHNRAGIEINDLDLAISRLGFEIVRNTAITLAVEQLFNASQHEHLRDRIKSIWRNSMSLASMCFVVARSSNSVNPDNAFLCGLLYEIGKLYILTKAREFPTLMGDDESLDSVLDQWFTSVGRSIVESWGFSADIAEAIDSAEGHSQDAGESATLVDVVYASRIVLDAEDVDLLETHSCYALDKLNIDSETLPALRIAYADHSQSVRQTARG